MTEGSRASGPTEVVVDGTDGAGKTPCVAFLVERLTARGLRVVTHAPYREEEVFPFWDSDPVRASSTIVGAMSRFRGSVPDADIIVWDRGWPTAFISTADRRARARFEPFPDVTLLLLNTIERTREVASRHPSAGVWATDECLVRRYHAAYHDLQVEGPTVLRFFPDRDARYHYERIGRELDGAITAVPRATVVPVG